MKDQSRKENPSPLRFSLFKAESDALLLDRFIDLLWESVWVQLVANSSLSWTDTHHNKVMQYTFPLYIHAYLLRPVWNFSDDGIKKHIKATVTSTGLNLKNKMHCSYFIYCTESLRARMSRSFYIKGHKQSTLILNGPGEWNV